MMGRWLATESIKSAALTLEGVHYIHCSHGLPAGVLGVRDRVADHVFEEYFQHAAGLFVNEPRNTFHATAASQTADRRLGDTLDVITQHFTVALSAALAKTFAALSASRHVAVLIPGWRRLQ